jgi:hypothetical protein
MEINITAATIYGLSDGDISATATPDAETISIWRLPKIAWASGILAAINLVIAACIAISPEIQVDIYGRAAGDVVLAHAKPSPFVEPEKPSPVRKAMKLTPVIEFVPEAASGMGVELTNMPAQSASVPAVYRQPEFVNAAERQMDFARTLIN